MSRGVGVGLSPMPCDSCTEAELDRFGPTFATDFKVFLWGLTVPAGLLLAAWVLPWQQRNKGRRTLLSALAPVSVVVLYLPFAGLVDWPAR
ncbi:hypothetical protein [Streptomyces lasiicapitis]|uniref:hypothetical protein n=1 Tax=Streptomyces lasiicapitis TaxID=1923961 RepID=UPI0036BC48F0